MVDRNRKEVDRMMTNLTETEGRLNLLDGRVTMNLSLNDLRLVVGCFRALAYQMSLDDEPYLDADGLVLKQRLEESYRAALEEVGF
jgi:hypothetical protein